MPTFFVNKPINTNKILEIDDHFTFGIDLVLVKKRKFIKLNWIEKNILRLSEEEINDQTDYLKEFLDNNEDWNLVYFDDFSYIYERTIE